MPIIVNNTTENSIIDIVCPHYCMGCGALGSLLCGCCKKYLFSESEMGKYEKNTDFWMCGKKTGLLEELVEKYKYGPVRGVGKVLADLLDESLPEMDDVVIIPLPTIARHVRERGFDHILYLAKRLARIRGWECRKLLVRQNSTVQVGANAKKRHEQAENAYDLRGRVEMNQRYLLLDDVVTTGASMAAAEKLLRQAGAKVVYKAVIARSS